MLLCNETHEAAIHRRCEYLPVITAEKSDPQAIILNNWLDKDSIALGTLEFYEQENIPLVI